MYTLKNTLSKNDIIESSKERQLLIVRRNSNDTSSAGRLLLVAVRVRTVFGFFGKYDQRIESESLNIKNVSK